MLLLWWLQFSFVALVLRTCDTFSVDVLVFLYVVFYRGTFSIRETSTCNDTRLVCYTYTYMWDIYIKQGKLSYHSQSESNSYRLPFYCHISQTKDKTSNLCMSHDQQVTLPYYLHSEIKNKHFPEDDSFLGWSTIIRAMMMGAVRTSEMLVYFHETTRHCIPETCYLHTRHCFHACIILV
jgi:hypothetical protein